MTLAELRTHRQLVMVARARELRRTGSSFRLIASEMGIGYSLARKLCKGTAVEATVLRNRFAEPVEPWNESRRQVTA